MKFNSVCTNIPQYDPDNGGFTDEEKALGRKNIGCGGISVLEQDTVPVYSGDLVLGRRTGGSMREIAVKLRDAIYGDSLAGYLVPPRTFKGMNLICDASGNITWGVQPPELKSGDYTWIDDHYHINVSGLQEELHFSYTPESAISAINGSAINGSEPLHYSGGDYVNIAGLVINVTGLQPSGDYAYNSAVSGKLDSSAYVEPVQSDWNQNDEDELDYIKNKPTIPSLEGYATEEYVNDQTSGKLDASAYHEYSAGLHLSLQDYTFNVTGLQEELQFDYDELGKISAINGSALYGNGGEAIEYSAGEHISIDNNVISVTGVQNLSAGPNVDIYEVDGHLEISATGGGGGGGEGETYYAGQYVQITDQNLINVTGLQSIAGMSAYARKSYVNNNFMNTSAMSAYATNQYVNNKFVFNSAYTAPVQSDWTEDDNTDLSYIKNKPTPIGLIPGPGIHLEDRTSAVMISCSASGGGGGSSYTAGQYIKIENDTISVTGVQSAGNYQPAGDYQPAGNYLTPSDLNGYATQNYVQQNVSGKANKTDLASYLPTSDYTAPVNADWSSEAGLSQILNKPDTEEIDIQELTPGQYISIQSGVISVTGISGTSGGPATSGYYTDLGGNSSFQDSFTYTYDGHFRMGSNERAMVPVSNVSSDEGKVPVVYVRDGRCYYLLERIIPSYNSDTNGKILGVQNNTLAWVNNPVKIVADSADIPASGSSDNILYVVAAD